MSKYAIKPWYSTIIYLSNVEHWAKECGHSYKFPFFAGPVIEKLVALISTKTVTKLGEIELKDLSAFACRKCNPPSSLQSGCPVPMVY